MGGEASPSLFLGDLTVVLEPVSICAVVLLVKGRGVHMQVEHSLISRPSLLSFPSLEVPIESWVGAWEQG